MPRFCIVLVEPQIPANIGMVCRAMANFGCTELRLVNPCDHLDPMAQRLAVGAAPLLASAECYPSLNAALADQHLSIAATRRAGRFRGDLHALEAYAPQLHELPPETRAALVFGREDAGLTRAEVEACHQSVTIRTAETLGSLNLAQAVLLFLYELHRSPSAPAPSPPQGPLPTHNDTEQLCTEVETLLARIAYLNPQRPDALMLPLRRLLQRANPDLAELNLLRGMFRHLAESANDWRGKRRGTR